MGKVKYLLDTNICIHFFNGQFDIDQKIIEIGFDNCYISEISILKLLYGVVNSSSTKKSHNLQKLEAFEKIISDRTLPIRPVFEDFASEKSRLRKLGTPISDFDLLIACTALKNDLILVSRNTKEMNRIEGLSLENWIDKV